MQGSNNSPLEIQTSHLLQKQVSDLITQLPSSYFSKHLLLHFDDIKKTKLFSILSQMPKGVLQHCHLECNEDAQFYREWIFNDANIYMTEVGQFKIGTAEEAEEKNWKPIKKIIEQKGEEYVINRSILNKDQIQKHSGEKSAWKIFQEKIEAFFPLIWADHIFKQYSIHIFKKFAKIGYSRLEFRALITNLTEYDSQGKVVKVHDPSRYLEQLDAAIQEVQKTYPKLEVGIIYNGLKLFPKQTNQSMFTEALKLKWKRGIGVDFVNQQDPWGSLEPYDQLIEEIFTKNPEYRLPKIYHAGQSNNHKNRNIEIAIKAGAKRIGHGFNILQNLDLLPLCRDVCFELNPLSNLFLNFTNDPRCGAAPVLMHFGIPVTINPDDPGKMGYVDSVPDFFVALTCYNWSLLDLKKTLLDSIKYAMCSADEKSLILTDFNKNWEEWLIRTSQVLKK